ncbi:DUF815 domain-containing protein [Altererythrobacter arenosus]|uniref:DUF815 domain-containing protein n=1 Tax=Altererythrobacter arenosus TaxID=3032592 RepID=A0ABY8FUI3_9SPHN|nr:DUF815 domain-containing protein [Altererythrobacter sp. CAU 1644]WFL78672.1 DUF815 domain-containing protein [Altererythrobacter sp. CAU 1644]
MADQGDPLARIAAALERIAPGAPRERSWTAHPAYFWHAGEVYPVDEIDALPLDRLRGIDQQKQAVVANIARHASGAAAHDMLLWGARGMGKSALLRAAVAAEQASDPGRLALIQLDSASLSALPELFTMLGSLERRFLLYLDDLAFDHGDDAMLRNLRSALEGSLAPRPANIRLAVTSNHRAILARDESDQSGPLHERDRMDDTLALADRFGLRLGFHPCSQDEYLAIVAAHAEPRGLSWSDEEALSWSRARGPLSGRSAWQFVVEIAGRAGQPL